MELTSVTISSSALANEIKTDYKNAIGCGRSDEEAFVFASRKLKEYASEDICTAYCALALVMHQMGRLTDSLKDTVISLIDAGGDLSYYKEKGAPEKMIEKRAKELEKVKKKLLSEQSEPKRATVSYRMICPWKTGDLIAYKMDVDGHTRYAVMAIVSVKHVIHELSELSHDELYVSLHDTLFEELPDLEACKELRFMEFTKLETTTDRKDKAINHQKAYIKEIVLSTKQQANRFYKACEKIGERKDIYALCTSIDECKVDGKNFEAMLQEAYQDYHGNSEKHVDIAKHAADKGVSLGKAVKKGGSTVKGSVSSFIRKTKHKAKEFSSKSVIKGKEIISKNKSKES